MPNLLCEKCGAQFVNIQEYREHKVDHALGRVEERSVEQLVGGDPTPEEAPQEIIAEPLADNIPAKSAKKDEKPPWADQPTVSKDNRKKQGSRLIYKYDGYCNHCGGEVETLEIDGVLEDQKKQIVIAWCPSCKKKLKQRQVLKL